MSSTACKSQTQILPTRRRFSSRSRVGSPAALRISSSGTAIVVFIRLSEYAHERPIPPCFQNPLQRIVITEVEREFGVAPRSCHVFDLSDGMPLSEKAPQHCPFSRTAEVQTRRVTESTKRDRVSPPAGHWSIWWSDSFPESDTMAEIRFTCLLPPAYCILPSASRRCSAGLQPGIFEIDNMSA